MDVAGRLAGLGSETTNRALSAMENGHGLDLGLLPDLASALDCSVTYLLGLTSDPHSWQPDDLVVDVPAAVRPASRSWILGPDVPVAPISRRVSPP